MTRPPHPRLVAMRRRILRIRQIVAGVAVAAFIALFSTVYVQMATGNDPALGSTATTAVASATTTTSSGETTSSEDTTSSEETTSSDETAAVTTAQS